MHLKLSSLIAAVAIAGLAACSTRPPAGSDFHVSLRGQADARAEAYRIGIGLESYAPVLLYDTERRVLNVSLTREASPERIGESLREMRVRARPGLSQPPREFVEQVICDKSQACDVQSRTKCQFVLTTSRNDYPDVYNRFARFILLSGYPALGVFYETGSTQDFSVSVPYYFGCADGIEELSEAWRRFAGPNAPAFRRLPATLPSSPPTATTISAAARRSPAATAR